MMQRWIQRMAVWMQGRYGPDELNLFLSRLGMLLCILSLFPPLRICGAAAWAVLGIAIFRMCSKNLPRRRQEREQYLVLRGRVRSRTALLRRRWQDRRTCRYYVCKQCGTTLRVPKGAGKIEITCPKCRRAFQKKT